MADLRVKPFDVLLIHCVDRRTAMGIPPDEYPVGQDGIVYSSTTSFDPQSGGKHVRAAEIRGN